MKKFLTYITVLGVLLPNLLITAQAANENEITEVLPSEELTLPEQTYLEPVISSEEAVEVQKSTILEATQSFLPNPEVEAIYSWDFGDGNKNEGIEVLHAYQKPGRYTVTLTITNGESTSTTTQEIFSYRKLILLITDQTEAKERIEIIKDFAEKKGVYIRVVESFGSGTEFISEEVLAKKLTEASNYLEKANEIIIWTKENAGLNALSRFIQSNPKKLENSFAQKTISILENNVGSNVSRIVRQYDLIKPKNIIIAKEGAIYPMIDSVDQQDFIDILEKGGYEYQIINENTGKIRPWNFMSYFVNLLINNGIPDNTIALLLLLPVIATIVAFMKQVVGITTFGIYTPSIITLSFLIIGMHAGLLTLATAILVGALSRPLLKKVRMLFIPKMAIVITIVSLTLFLILIASTYLGLFNAQFLSIAIFPMLILSTLVEKFVSVKTGKGLSSAFALMLSTVLVSIIAYFIVGGEINLGFTTIKFEMVKSLVLTYPEIILLLIGIDFLLGKWSGLRVLERIRFREVLRHIEEEE